MAKQKIQIIKPIEAYQAMSDVDVSTRTDNVATGLDGNVNYTNPAPPVAPKDLKAANDQFRALIAQAADGSRTVKAQKNKMRHEIIKDMRLLGRYVEKVSNGDMAIFTSSGFEPAPAVRTPQQPISPTFKTVVHGPNSGEIDVRLNAVAGAASYEMRYAATANGVAGNWTVLPLAHTRLPVKLTGLTPGTVYAFQARSLGNAGYSDWGDSVTLMCN